MPGSTAQNSSEIRLCSKNPYPAPPYSSSIKTPTKPSSQAFRQMSRSKVSSRSNSWALSGNSPSANSLAACLISSCSLFSLKSMMMFSCSLYNIFFPHADIDEHCSKTARWASWPWPFPSALRGERLEAEMALPGLFHGKGNE